MPFSVEVVDYQVPNQWLDGCIRRNLATAAFQLGSAKEGGKIGGERKRKIRKRKREEEKEEEEGKKNPKTKRVEKEEEEEKKTKKKRRYRWL